MVKFHQLLARLEDDVSDLQYHISNPIPTWEWFENIRATLDSISYQSSMIREREVSPDKLVEELEIYYGEDSDGTYKDFELSKIMKSSSQIMSESIQEEF